MFIGLLMVANEDDILERVLAHHEQTVDCFYVLDGTRQNIRSFETCNRSDKCAGYWTDYDLPRPPYPRGTVCGYRGFIHDKAVEDHGFDHWFVELHGDEVWTFHPSQAVADHPEADGFIFPLPFYFPRVEDGWDPQVHPLDQLWWHLKPGWPEFRLYHGGPHVRWNPEQHFNTQPDGLSNVVYDQRPIKHYPYRSPDSQRDKAALHSRTGFDPDNYTHILNDDAVLWTRQMIEQAKCEAHSILAVEVPLEAGG